MVDLKHCGIYWGESAKCTPSYPRRFKPCRQRCMWILQLNSKALRQVGLTPGPLKFKCVCVCVCVASMQEHVRTQITAAVADSAGCPAAALCWNNDGVREDP